MGSSGFPSGSSSSRDIAAFVSLISLRDNKGMIQKWIIEGAVDDIKIVDLGRMVLAKSSPKSAADAGLL